MNKEKLLEIEKNELNTLINKGVSFEVEETQWKRPQGWLGFLKKRVPVKVTHTFQVEEPTLRTLDLISAESIEMVIDESLLSSSNSISEAKKLTKEHAARCAKVLALAVLGSEYVIPVTSMKGVTRTKYNEKRLNELTDLFFRSVKPSKLLQLVLLVNTMMNLGDFTNSIRLMSGARTTTPGRIEEKQQA